jgi:hypothetical protein
MLEISETDILNSLKRDNPWWESKEVPAVAEFANERAYFKSFSALALNWDIKRTTILMGPRR